MPIVAAASCSIAAYYRLLPPHPRGLWFAARVVAAHFVHHLCERRVVRARHGPAITRACSSASACTTAVDAAGGSSALRPARSAAGGADEVHRLHDGVTAIPRGRRVATAGSRPAACGAASADACCWPCCSAGVRLRRRGATCRCKATCRRHLMNGVFFMDARATTCRSGRSAEALEYARLLLRALSRAVDRPSPVSDCARRGPGLRRARHLGHLGPPGGAGFSSPLAVIYLYKLAWRSSCFDDAWAAAAAAGIVLASSGYLVEVDAGCDDRGAGPGADRWPRRLLLPSLRHDRAALARHPAWPRCWRPASAWAKQLAVVVMPGMILYVWWHVGWRRLVRRDVLIVATVVSGRHRGRAARAAHDHTCRRSTSPPGGRASASERTARADWSRARDACRRCVALARGAVDPAGRSCSGCIGFVLMCCAPPSRRALAGRRSGLPASTAFVRRRSSSTPEPSALQRSTGCRPGRSCVGAPQFPALRRASRLASRGAVGRRRVATRLPGVAGRARIRMPRARTDTRQAARHVRGAEPRLARP